VKRRKLKSMPPAKVRKSASSVSGPAKLAAKRAPAPPMRPAPPTEVPRFAGVPSFLRVPVVDGEPESDAVADVLLVGAPLDAGTTFRPGARLAPCAVRQASSLARPFNVALGVDIDEELTVADNGDLPLPPHDLDQSLELIADRAAAITRCGAVPGFVGGDQSTTLGVLRGIRRAKLKAATLLHFDAHSNCGGTMWGQQAHHGSAIRVAVEEGLVDPRHTMQVGLRGPYSTSKDLDFALAHGFDLVGVDDARWDIHSVVGQIRRAARHGPLYVSVDVAVLDPAYAPGTGIPSPGGLTTWELQQLLRALVGADIVGFDVVEIAPPYDPQGHTALVGVSIIQELLSAIADTRRSATAISSPHRGPERRRSP
jgi:agmatinase